MQQKPYWTSSIKREYYNTTYDGVNYDMEESELMWGSYYFLSSDRGEHQRTVFNITHLLSYVGGISNIVMQFIGSLGYYINMQIFLAKVISQIYFYSCSEHTKENL